MKTKMEPCITIYCTFSYFTNLYILLSLLNFIAVRAMQMKHKLICTTIPLHIMVTCLVCTFLYFFIAVKTLKDYTQTALL